MTVSVPTVRPINMSGFTYNPQMANFGNPFSGVQEYTQFLLKFASATPTYSYNTMPFLFNTLKFNSGNNGFSNKSTRLNGGFGENILSTAYKYKGYNESNGSYKLFTNGRKEAWCADFVSYVVKEAAQNSGKSIPSGFGSASVEELRQWGKSNNCYLQTSNSSNKESLIKNNVKRGDVIIFKENGRSHTGIVAGIDSNGKIRTIEGNTSDKVAERTYSINDSSISGFIQLA